MQLGEVIRKYRKLKNLTQEEMARRLGVSAPAVNKWERGNSCPDIALLAPIARLLDITPDVLLSFREELTPEEISEIVRELDSLLETEPYENALEWAKKKLEQFPACGQLLWQLAVILDAGPLRQELPDDEERDEYLCSLYRRALETGDESVRCHAADSLFAFYLRRQHYDRAEECLDWLSDQNPLKKLRQAQLLGRTDRIPEAYRTYEELLFSTCQTARAALWGMYSLAMGEGDRERAKMLADKLGELAKCFELGQYHEVSPGLEPAALEEDADAVLKIMRQMLEGLEQIDGFRRSPLYAHMEFKEVRGEFAEKLKKDLLNGFRDGETFGFLRDEPGYRELCSPTSGPSEAAPGPDRPPSA